MAFPEASVLDNFNRSDEGPPPSASWASITGLNGLKVLANECVADGASNNAAVYNTSYGPDMDAFVTIATLPGGAGRAWVIARLQQYGASSTIDGYIVEYQHSVTTVRIRVLVNGTPTTVQESTQSMGAGDALGIRCFGSEISAWIKPSGGGWRNVSAVVDATISAAGPAGLLMTDATTTFDDFGAGNATIQLHGFMTPNKGFW